MIAIIPARGGSKGVRGKNIKEICGKPLIAYTIEAAKKAKGIDRVIVSTDNEEIAKVALQYGAEVPFIRPKELSLDNSLARDVYLHAIDFIRNKENVKIQKFMVLLPTAPMRKSKHIDEALKLFEQENAETLISMCEAETPVSWYFEMNLNRTIKNAGFDLENSLQNRQNNKKYYIPNGAIYILDYTLLKEKGTYYSNNSYAYIMTKKESVDIDTQDDFDYAEYLISEMKG